jgi:hypothetical protein
MEKTALLVSSLESAQNAFSLVKPTIESDSYKYDAPLSVEKDEPMTEFLFEDRSIGVNTGR